MRFSRFLLPLLALGFVAAAHKPPLSIRFHTETNPNGGEPFSLTVPLPNSPRKICLSKIAAISENDVVAIYPFPADDGTQGCAFKLDEHGRIALDTLSEQSHGSIMVGFVNNRAVTAMLIDRKVTSGVIYIARGLRPEEIVLLGKHYPTLGAKKKKAAVKHTAQVDPDVAPAPASTPATSSTARGD